MGLTQSILFQNLGTLRDLKKITVAWFFPKLYLNCINMEIIYQLSCKLLLLTFYHTIIFNRTQLVLTKPTKIRENIKKKYELKVQNIGVFSVLIFLSVFCICIYMCRHKVSNSVLRCPPACPGLFFFCCRFPSLSIGCLLAAGWLLLLLHPIPDSQISANKNTKQDTHTLSEGLYKQNKQEQTTAHAEGSFAAPAKWWNSEFTLQLMLMIVLYTHPHTHASVGPKL